MNNIKIESRAIDEVRKLINNSDIMTSEEIQEGDKAISLDGFIPIYFNKNIKKENFHNKIDIQVKGRTVQQLSNSNRLNFSMDKKDIINYKKIGGAIIFYVQITEDRKQARLYIKPLLPYEINELLDYNTKNKIQLNFEFISVEDNEKFEMLCFQFQKDKDKQYSYRTKNKTMEDFKQEKGVFKVEFSISNEISKNPLEYLKRPSYVYFEPENYKEVKIPCGIVNFDSFKIAQKKEIIIGEKKYFADVEIEKTENNTLIFINKSIKYDFANNMFTFYLNGCLTKALDNIKIISELRNFKSMEINSAKISICDDGEYTILDHQIEVILKLKQIKDLLRINEEIYIDFSDIKSIKHIGLIYNNLIDKTGIPFKYDADCFMIKLKIFNIEVAFSVSKNEDGLFDMENLFDVLVCNDERFSYINKESNRVILYPNFVIFQEQFQMDPSYLFTANIVDRLEELEIDRTKIIGNQVLEEHLNWFILDLLCLYDSSADLRMLNYAEKISLILSEAKCDVHKINYYQTLKRKQKLTSEQIKTLVEIRHKTDDIMIKCSVSILLESNEQEFYFNELTSEQKKIFMSYPIYKLYKNS